MGAVMTDRFEQYRRNAAYARQWAERASNADDKNKWLKLADGWQSLIRVRPQSTQELQQAADEKFDQAISEHGTGQDVTNSSH